MSIVLVRHTRPAVGSGICYGRTDLALADSFEREARKVLASLRSSDVLITSPLQRCRMLADEIGSAFDLAPQTDDRVQEMDFGDWEGRPWSDIPRDELDEWAQDFLHARPHRGESVAMLRERTLSAIADYRASRRRYIVVTHSGIIKAALATGDSADHFSTRVDFGAAIELPERGM